MKKVFFLLTFFVWVGGLYASASSFNSESLLSLPIVAPDTTIEFCPGTSVTLNTTYNASVDESYSWHEDSPTGSVESIEDAITVSPSGNKDFVLIVTQSDNVTETYRRIFHLQQKPVTTVVSPVVACGTYTWPVNGQTYLTDAVVTVNGGTGTNGCDSVLVLQLTVKQNSAFTDVKTACESFTWIDGQTYTDNNNTAQVVLNNTQGCDSTVTLNLIVNHAYPISNTQSVCDTYTWTTGNGTVYTTSGNYTYAHADANGCTQVDTLHLTILHRTYGDTVAEACDQYTWRGVSYTNSTDTATRVLVNVVGCDSTLTLHLTVKRSNSGDTMAIVCEQFQWWNTNYTSSTNTPTHVYTNAAGCDSTVTLHLTINNPVHTAATVTACETYTWTAGNGTTYTNSANPTWQHYDVNGCVQVDTLHLTVYHASHASNSQSVCDTYTWITGNGTVYTTSGNYTYTHLDANGCTQVDTLHLTVLYSNTGVEPVAECDRFVWHGTTYTESTNAPIFVETNADGCDSVVTLHLTIKRSTSSIETIVACKDYIWHGTTYTESNDTATYTDTNVDGCDSVVTLNLTIWPYDVPPVRQLYEKKHKESQNPWMLIYPKDNNSDEFNYQWYRNDVPIHGANQQYYQLQNEATGSTVTYMVNVANSNMSVCSSNSTKTITFMAEKTVVITTYPNPSNGTFTIDITGMENVREAIFYNAYGVEVLRLPVKSNRVDVNGQLQKGVYMVSLVSADGNNHTDKIIVN